MKSFLIGITFIIVISLSGCIPTYTHNRSINISQKGCGNSEVIINRQDTETIIIINGERLK